MAVCPFGAMAEMAGEQFPAQPVHRIFQQRTVYCAILQNSGSLGQKLAAIWILVWPDMVNSLNRGFPYVILILNSPTAR